MTEINHDWAVQIAKFLSRDDFYPQAKQLAEAYLDLKARYDALKYASQKVVNDYEKLSPPNPKEQQKNAEFIDMVHGVCENPKPPVYLNEPKTKE